jgi:alpha-D-ribose 1-methylphosphonate 5-triphosphate diphosphatase
MWLNDLRIVLPDGVLERGSLRIEDGCIADIVKGPAPQPGLNVQGLTALPGIVDLHGDMLEREIEPRPESHFPIDMALLELDKRLASAGVTTAYAAVGFWVYEKRKIRTIEKACAIVDTVNDMRDALLVDFYVHARYEITTPSVADALAKRITDGQVQLVSLMDHTPGQGQYRNLERYFEFMAKWRNVPREAVEASFQERMDHLESIAEMIWPAANQIAGLTLDCGIPLASHDDDTTDKVKLVSGLGASISEFPVTLEAAQEAQRRGMRTVMGAPNTLRGASHSGNLSATEAIEVGTVDVLASDYHPGSLLHAALALADTGRLPLHEAAKLISQNPAAAVGLHDRGSIQVGRAADMVLVEMAEPASTRAPSRARVRATLRRGEPIYSDIYMARLSADLSESFSHHMTVDSLMDKVLEPQAVNN